MLKQNDEYYEKQENVFKYLETMIDNKWNTAKNTKCKYYWGIKLTMEGRISKKISKEQYKYWQKVFSIIVVKYERWEKKKKES